MRPIRSFYLGTVVLTAAILAGCSQNAMDTLDAKLWEIDRTMEQALIGRRGGTPGNHGTGGSASAETSASSTSASGAPPSDLAAFFGRRQGEPVVDGPEQDAYKRGVALIEGDGVSQDKEAGIRHLETAAEAGHPDAQFLLGLAYRSGEGVARDDEKAFQLFQEAATQDHNDAAFLIGLSFLRGRGADEDREAAGRWFKRAAETGHAGAQYHLGVAYLTGSGVPKDAGKALPWLAAAAQTGHAEAQYVLASAYTNGRGTEPDHPWAAMWYGLAAEKGLAEAQYMLGVSYAGGIGLPKDNKAAAFWFTLAADRGSKDAEWLLPGARSRLDDAEVAEIERKAEGWRPVDAADPQTGPIVRYVQYALKQLDYGPGPVDGNWGSDSREALNSYRMTQGLQPTSRIVAGDLFRLRADLRSGGGTPQT